MDEEAEIIVGTYDDYVVGYRLETIVSQRANNGTGPKRKQLKTTNSGDAKSNTNGQDNVRHCLEHTFAVRSHSGSVRCLAASADGSLVFSAGHDEMINLFNLKRRKLLQTLEGAINCAIFVGSSHLLCGSEDGNVYIYECKASNVKLVKTLKGHKAAVVSLDAHPSGKVLLSLSKDNTMRTWNLIKGRSAYTTNIKSQAHLVKWSSTGDEFLLAANNEICLFNSESGSLERSIKLEKRINSIEFITDHVFIVTTDSCRLEFFDLKTGESLMKFDAHETRIKSVKCCCSIDHQSDQSTTEIMLATASSDGQMKLWSVTIGAGLSEPRELASTDLGARLTCMVVAVRSGGGDAG